MVYKVILTRPARTDLLGIGKYIAKHNPVAAQRLVQNLVDTAFSLAQIPLKGRAVRRKPGVRRLIHGSYLIYYRVEKDTSIVRVLRFWHGARHPETPQL